MWVSEDNQDNLCVKSRTGFVMTLGSTQGMCVYKTSAEIYLINTEAEYVALIHSTKQFMPLRWLIEELGDALGLEREQQ